jgi:hypothetical protein
MNPIMLTGDPVDEMRAMATSVCPDPYCHVHFISLRSVNEPYTVRSSASHQFRAQNRFDVSLSGTAHSEKSRLVLSAENTSESTLRGLTIKFANSSR